MQAVILLLVLLAGCTAFSSAESRFFSKFSLRELVQKNKSQSGLNCSNSAGGGGGGIGSITGIGAKQSRFHKGESISCAMADAGQFDEGKFIEALKQVVEADLHESNAKIVGSKNPDAASFYFEYTLEEIKGSVKLSGSKVLGNYYSLTANLEEKSGNSK
jgi:hypothetical protein